MGLSAKFNKSDLLISFKKWVWTHLKGGPLELPTNKTWPKPDPFDVEELSYCFRNQQQRLPGACFTFSRVNLTTSSWPLGTWTEPTGWWEHGQVKLHYARTSTLLLPRPMVASTLAVENGHWPRIYLIPKLHQLGAVLQILLRAKSGVTLRPKWCERGLQVALLLVVDSGMAIPAVWMWWDAVLSERALDTLHILCTFLYHCPLASTAAKVERTVIVLKFVCWSLMILRQMKGRVRMSVVWVDWSIRPSINKLVKQNLSTCHLWKLIVYGLHWLPIS